MSHDVFNTPGAHSWTCPANVTAIRVVIRGGGAGGYSPSPWTGGAGGAAPTIPTTSGRVLPIGFIRLASGEWLGIPGSECY